MTDQIIVTCALPYANGDIHLGHMVEHIQGDIWVRFKKLTGTRCYFIGADDTHGTPVMLKAESLNLTPEEMITQVHKEHVADLKFFDIAYDEFYTTHSPENQEIVYEVFHKLQQNNKICTKTIDQLFDTTKNMFLPDRFVKGTCPKCNALEQYGDNCEVCGATYSPIELKEPYSTISQSKPTVKSSMHFFFKLSECSDFLSKWLNADGHLQLETRNKMQEWLLSGLTDWDISRDKPYFGFAIPDYPDKYFYVWLDAPIGYMSSFMHFCKKNNLDFVNLWNSSKLYHFIGKDILYFHALFWPSVLNYSGYK
ncbi:MAG: methionine--tRNA ligase, partial [Burkholderiales bacterium]|nr:methionine--tRNA ligase [Burkholderiales bacterium]